MPKDNDQDYSSVAEQIGSIGGNQEHESLGRLENIGNKPPLDDNQKRSLESFLQKSNDLHEERLGANSYDIMSGWTPIDRSRMGFRSTFYPEDWQFRVRPATVEAIKNWSSIDESDLQTQNNLFNEVLKECVSIHTKTGNKSWGKIASWDRLWFMTLVREYTFAKGEVAITFTEKCPICGNEITYNLEPDQLHFELPDIEDIDMSQYNKTDRCWYINTQDYGLDSGMIKIYIPTLEKDATVLNWAYRKANQNNGKVPSTALLRVLPWIVEQGSTVDERVDQIVEKAIKVYESWDAETYEFVENVIKNIQVVQKETLSKTCDRCGEEAVSEMKFPNGVKSLFSVQNRFKKFGKK